MAYPENSCKTLCIAESTCNGNVLVVPMVNYMLSRYTNGYYIDDGNNKCSVCDNDKHYYLDNTTNKCTKYCNATDGDENQNCLMVVVNQMVHVNVLTMKKIIQAIVIGEVHNVIFVNKMIL